MGGRRKSTLPSPHAGRPLILRMGGDAVCDERPMNSEISWEKSPIKCVQNERFLGIFFCLNAIPVLEFNNETEKTQNFFRNNLTFKREPDLNCKTSFRQKNGFLPETGID
jgi:hypothetical protein